MFNQLATQANEIPEPRLPDPGPPPDPERAEQPPVPATAYMPYPEKSAPSEPLYKPYGEEPAPNERPYEPYKDI
jgi:hypothetical protein